MDPFIGEIRAVAFPFAPVNWAVCDGSLLSTRQYTALFSLLGTQYGGNGQTTFALPDLRGRAVVNAGRGPGLTAYPIGQQAGTESVTLTLPQLPAHTHAFGGSFNVSTGVGSLSSPANNFLAVAPDFQYAEAAGGSTTMAKDFISGKGSAVGGGQAHTNQQPYLALYYIIALLGVLPQRP